MARHELKIWRDYFMEICRGEKTAEIRNDDRGYSTGDILILKEWQTRKKRFTGREIEVLVVGIQRLGSLIAHPYLADWVLLYFVPRSSFGCRFKMPEEKAISMSSPLRKIKLVEPTTGAAPL